MGGITVPIWTVVAATITVAGAPWNPRRYSVRTLLIATALVAVVFGLAV